MKEQLYKIIQNYYPIGINALLEKDKYIKSEEYLNLISLIDNNKKKYADEIQVIINEVTSDGNIIFNDLSYFEWLDRCYTLEFIQVVRGRMYVYRFYKSILGSYFIQRFFCVEYLNNREKVVKISQKEFLDDVGILNKIQDLVFRLNLTQLDDIILGEVIENVSFEDIGFESFNYFNAFFLSQDV